MPNAITNINKENKMSDNKKAALVGVLILAASCVEYLLMWAGL